MIRDVLEKLVERKDLNEAEAALAMSNIMDGVTSAPQIAGFLTALRMKGETVEELYAFAKTMRKKAIGISVPENTLDTCGTGGDRLGTFNISTASAFVIASAGTPVAKHGNRSVSSKCGSADLLEELKVHIDLTPLQTERCVNDIGIGFLFAPLFHHAMKYAIAPRRELGLRTVFNVLGPLTNPANVKYQLMGVYDSELTEPLAKVLGRFGLEHAIVAHGSGLDELTTTGSTRISELEHGKVESYEITPDDFGLARVHVRDIAGGSPDTNAKILTEVLDGNPSPYVDIVLLNAGAGLYVSNMVKDIGEGIELARNAIVEGHAKAKFESFRNYSLKLFKEG